MGNLASCPMKLVVISVFLIPAQKKESCSFATTKSLIIKEINNEPKK